MATRARIHKVVPVWALLAALLLLFAGCKAQNTPPLETTTAVTTTEPPATTTEIPVVRAFNVGDGIILENMRIRLADITENNGNDTAAPAAGNVFVLCTFEIENTSGQDIFINSLFSFQGYADGQIVPVSVAALLASDVKQLDGRFPPGEKTEGVVGFEIPESWEKFEVEFTYNTAGDSVKYAATKAK